MAELLKHIYNKIFFENYCKALSDTLNPFDSEEFMSKVINDYWENYELKQRMKHLAIITDEYLPTQFKDKVKCILKIIDNLRFQGIKDQNLDYIFLADIITMHGLDNLNTSIQAIENITKFTSFEFAGRQFLIQYPEIFMNQMHEWSKHDHPSVRRYASEGCRPRLPWGLQLKQFVCDPSPILPILDNLKDDPSEYVRKSVANNLNDISKDHPDIVIDIIKNWKGNSKNTDWILKQASRTLLKKGHSEVLELFGTSSNTAFKLTHFKIDKDRISLGETITFQFDLLNKEESAAKFRVEYLIDFVKSNGQRSKKIFKICEIIIEPGQTLKSTKKHKFIDLTTRKHYIGTHKIAIIVNGVENEWLAFDILTSST